MIAVAAPGWRGTTKARIRPMNDATGQQKFG